MKNLRQYLNNLIKRFVDDENYYSKICTVLSVDDENRTCEVEPIDGTVEYDEARLQAEIAGSVGIYLKPKVGSFVVVDFSTRDLPIIVQTSDVDDIDIVANTSIKVECNDVSFNGGQNNGLVIVGKLVEKLNNLENKYNQLIALYNAHTHPVSGTVAGPTTNLVTSALAPTLQTEIENTKVKH